MRWSVAIVLVLGTAWYGYAAPRLADAATRRRVEATRVPDLREMHGYAEVHPERVTRSVTRGFAEGEGLAARDEAWSGAVGALLTDAQRAEGIAAEVGPVATPTELRVIEPELWGLAQALLTRYGWADVTPPPAPGADPWRGLARSRQARAVRALTEAGSLSPEVAHLILVATLQLLEVQTARRDLEARVWGELFDVRFSPQR